MMDLHFESGGKFTSRGEWIHPARVASSYEWIVMTEGEAYLEEDGQDYALSAGTALLLEPGHAHRGIRPSCERVSFYWIHFHGEHPALPQKCFALSHRYEVSLLCRQLLHYTQSGHPPTTADALLSVLVTELCLQSQNAVGNANALVNRVTEWVRTNCDRPILARDVAAHFGYHADYLSRLCHEQLGHGLKAEIDLCRCRTAKRLLLESDLSLYEIADRVGIPDYKLFLKFFKYHEGMTPSEFRALYPSMHTNNR